LVPCVVDLSVGWNTFALILLDFSNHSVFFSGRVSALGWLTLNRLTFGRLCLDRLTFDWLAFFFLDYWLVFCGGFCTTYFVYDFWHLNIVTGGHLVYLNRVFFSVHFEFKVVLGNRFLIQISFKL
jgi:hypothetical protein